MSVIDLANLKTQIKSTLDTANTTTASTDLSGSMSTRIQKVLTVNPAKIPPQASFYPFVSVYVDSKSFNEETFSIGVSRGKRMGDVKLTIIGAVFHSPITSNLDDPTELDVNYLMENIEQILRDNYNLNGACKWHLPESVDYFDVFNGDEPYLKAGELKISCKIEY